MADTNTQSAPATQSAPKPVPIPEIKPSAVTPGGVKAPTPPAEELETYIVEGKEVKLTKSQAKAAVQKGLFADKRLKSMDVLARSSQAIVEALKTPAGVINLLKDKSLGNSPKAVLNALLSSDAIDDEVKDILSKWVYENVVHKAKLTPEQIEQERKLADYDKLKKAEDDRRTADLTRQQQEQVSQIQQAVKAEVSKQILADKTFPQTEATVRQVFEKLRVMNKKGAKITVESVTKALNLVKDDFLAHQSAILDAFDDPEQLIKAIGEPRALKISKALIARLKAKEGVTKKAEKQEERGRRVTEELDERNGRHPLGYQLTKF